MRRATAIGCLVPVIAVAGAVVFFYFSWYTGWGAVTHGNGGQGDALVARANLLMYGSFACLAVAMGACVWGLIMRKRGHPKP